MKKSNLVLIIFIIALVVIGWLMYVSQISNAAQTQEELMSQAEEYSEKTLYQKAAACYEKVLEEEESLSTRELWIEAYKNAYVDKAISLGEYASALDKMCEMYPQETEYWEILLSVYLRNDQLQKAYEIYKKCEKAGGVDDTIKALGKTILYACNLTGRAYSEYTCNAGGYYTVFNGDAWGVLDSAGETVFDCEYSYISPYGQSQTALYVMDDQRIINAEAIVEAKVKTSITKAGAYGEGLIPVCGINGKWQYLNCEEDKCLEGKYDKASNYINGIAAVCEAGKWTLIDIEGESVCDTIFSDIKLHSNGDYLFDDIMVAAVDGEYGFYNAKGDLVENIEAKDMDVYKGGDVAFKDDSGKWGFVNTNGKETIKPQFAEAKSFAKGLAAVSNGEKWGFIDIEGDVVIAYKYVDAGYFTAMGTCMVSIVEGQYNLLKLKFV